MVSEIIKEILKHLPKEKISAAVFEGANIVLYTKDREFFLNDGGIIRNIVNKIKKRIELRPDPAITKDEGFAEEELKRLIGEEANIGNIIFDKQRSIVIIEAEKPGVVIGKQGENLQVIRENTMWVPQIKRLPPVRSSIIENIRSVLYENSDYRRKFLNKTGERVYNGWLRQKKEEWVRITYLGGARQVGRSALFLQTPESRILLDCGIDPSKIEETFPHLEAPEFKIEELDAIIITNAHLDHSGFTPWLYKYGYRGPVYCTAPTRDIMALLQLDVVKIQSNEGREPIYNSDDIREMVKHTITLDYESVTDVTPDIRITLYNAGYLLGSSMVHVHVGNGLHNMLFTSNIKFTKTNLLPSAITQFPRLETLMIEATYGGRDNILPNLREQDAMLADAIKETIDNKGKILIPTLGSGKGQEIVIMMERLIRQGIIPNIPVYIDGMVWDITAIHTAYPEFLNSAVRSQIFHKDNNPFLKDNIKRIESPKERQEVIDSNKPCLILATSGMLVGGPSVEYLKGLCGDEKNLLVFSSYQAEGSLGKRIMTGERTFSFKNNNGGNVHEIKMQVHRMELTGNADRRELLGFINRLNPRPKRILVSHGEATRCLEFASTIHKSLRVETFVPRNLDTVRLK